MHYQLLLFFSVYFTYSTIIVLLVIIHKGLGVLLFCALFAFMCGALKEIVYYIVLTF